MMPMEIVNRRHCAIDGDRARINWPANGQWAAYGAVILDNAPAPMIEKLMFISVRAHLVAI